MLIFFCFFFLLSSRKRMDKRQIMAYNIDYNCYMQMVSTLFNMNLLFV